MKSLHTASRGVWLLPSARQRWAALPAGAQRAHLICSKRSCVPSTSLEPRPARLARPRPACMI